MRSFMQNKCAVFVTKHQTLKEWQQFLFNVSIGYLFIDLSTFTIEKCTLRVALEVTTRKVLKFYIVPFLSVNFLVKFHGKPSILYTLLIHLKMRGSLEKRVQDMSHFLTEICLLKKPPANEITEPLAFTVCKVELCSKAIVLQSCFSFGSCSSFLPSYQLRSSRLNDELLNSHHITAR